MSTYLPLTALRAFHHVAETLSFTRAAEQLHVSQSAVSQQVALLEDRVGKRLVERVGRSVRLTPPGELLAATCQRSFGALGRTLQEISHAGRPASLQLKLPPSFAMKWLMPRLPSFQVMHPQLELGISTSVHAVDFESENVDIGMQRSEQADASLHATAILDERGILVCSPKLWGKRSARVSHLESMTLLHSANRPDDWPLWLDAMGRADLKPANQIEFGFSLLMLQAATEGLGVAIAQPEFVQDELASGRLIAPFDTVINTGRKHFIVCQASRRHEAAIASFFNWVTSIQYANDASKTR
jgi:LysR family transcriptional regulator, glycine cleavage system transcriptional activator